MTKTLAIILNHNLPEYTDWLYRTLVRFKEDIYDLVVVDNGSKKEYTSKFTHIRYEENFFWGGALNRAFAMVLEKPEYDSLLFLNNDIEVTGEIFMKSLRNVLFQKDLAIVSPCIAGRQQPWRQMQNWGSPEPRIVKWIDLMAPLFHRKFIEKVRQFPAELYIGWGQELLSFDVCAENRWKMAVCDHICVLHHGKQTLHKNQLYSLGHAEDDTTGAGQGFVSWDSYKAEAMRTRDAYFAAHPLQHDTFANLIDYGHNYVFRPQGRS